MVALAKAKAVILEKTDDRILGQPARKFDKFVIRKRIFNRVDTAHISCYFRDARREGRRIEESEPPYKTARRDDIVIMIDGETFCVPEEDVPKVYYEGDDQVTLLSKHTRASRGNSN